MDAFVTKISNFLSVVILANWKLSIAFNRIKILFIPLFCLIKMPQIKNTSQFVALIH